MTRTSWLTRTLAALTLLASIVALPTSAQATRDPAPFAGWTQLGPNGVETVCVGTCSGWAWSPYWVSTYDLQVSGKTIARLKVTAQVYFPCSGCAPTAARGFATAERFSPATRIMLGQDVPTQPALWLTWVRPAGGVAAIQSTHVSTGVNCCVAAWTNPRMLTEAGSGALGVVGWNVRAWVTVWIGSTVYEVTGVGNDTSRIYVDEGPGIGAGTCVGYHCGGLV